MDENKLNYSLPKPLDILDDDKLNFTLDDYGSAKWYYNQYPNFEDNVYPVLEKITKGSLASRRDRRKIKKQQYKLKLKKEKKLRKALQQLDVIKNKEVIEDEKESEDGFCIIDEGRYLLTPNE